jgi:hypothetical protein
LYQSYLLKYNKIPDRSNFVEYFSSIPVLTEKSKDFLKNSLIWMYEPISDVQIVEEKLLEEVKKKMFRNAIFASMNALESGKELEEAGNLYKKLQKINDLQAKTSTSGIMLLKDLNKVFLNSKIVYPTCFAGLNAMTALGGFHTPQSIVWMAPPKAFKTGLMLKIAYGWIMDGLDGAYFDFENGENDLHLRLKQLMLECKIEKVWENASVLSQIKDKLKMFQSGELFIKRYQKRKDHPGTLRHDIDMLLDKGYDPKFMIIDYVDIMGCEQKGLDKREQIQYNYAGIDNLNNNYGMFSMTISKIKQSAVGKDVYDPTDAGEDFEKIYNAHAVFGLHRSDEDAAQNIASITSVVQRQGRGDLRCLLHLDAEKFIINELK